MFFSLGRFVIFDKVSVNRGLPVLEAARGLDSWRRPEGSQPLGTRMFTTLRKAGHYTVPPKTMKIELKQR